MNRCPASSVVALALTLFAAGRTLAASGGAPAQPGGPSRPRVVGPHLLQATYARLPIAFEAVPDRVRASNRFRAHGPGYSLLVSPSSAVLGLRQPTVQPAAMRHGPTAEQTPIAGSPTRVVRLELLGANPWAHGRGLDALPGKVHYYVGKDPKQWLANVATYARVKYEGVYPGVDLVYHGSQGQLEYDFVVAPGASPTAIRLGMRGADKVAVDPRGDLVLQTAGGTIRQRRPRLYQERAGHRQEVAGGYVLQGDHRVGFRVGAYDRTRPLIIDPVLLYSSFLGGNGPDQGLSIAVDPAGGIYVTGVTSSPMGFPTTAGALQSARAGQNVLAFVTKIDPTKTGAAALIYSTYLGGGGNTAGRAIKVDAAGNAFITGQTVSLDFPTTPDAIMTHLTNTNSEAFVTKLSPTGALVYSTYLGGSAADVGRAIAIDGAGSAYVTGGTQSADFPTTTGAFQRTYGGNGDAFVAKIDPTKAGAAGLVYSTFLGGKSHEGKTGPTGDGVTLGDDEAYDIAVDAAGNAYVTGETASDDFPTTPGAYQRGFLQIPGFETLDDTAAFVTKIDTTKAGAASLVYSTFLGATLPSSAAGLLGANNIGFGIAADGAGNAYVTGVTQSTRFPTTPGAFQTEYGGGKGDAFVVKLDTTKTGAASLIYSTLLGGSENDEGYEIAIDSTGSAYVTGGTISTDFPATPGALQTKLALSSNSSPSVDAFVTKVGPTGAFLYYSTYLGGSGNDLGFGIAVDAAGNIYVTGTTESSDFPTTTNASERSYAGAVGKNPNAIAGDAFVLKIGG